MRCAIWWLYCWWTPSQLRNSQQPPWERSRVIHDRIGSKTSYVLPVNTHDWCGCRHSQFISMKTSTIYPLRSTKKEQKKNSRRGDRYEIMSTQSWCSGWQRMLLPCAEGLKDWWLSGRNHLIMNQSKSQELWHVIDQCIWKSLYPLL